MADSQPLLTMHFKNLDLNLLVALDALLAERNITLAGKRVYLTQSAMSGALSRLREYFRDDLLVQVGRKMVPTPLGESLVEPVRQILLQVQATIATKPAFDPATSTRRFRLMMSDYVATVLMTEALPMLETVAPSVTIDILSNDVEQPVDHVERADVDLLIMPQSFLSPAHPDEVLFEDHYICAVWRENPLVGNTLPLEDYLKMGHVVVHFSTSRATAIDEWFANRQGHVRRAEVMAMNFNSVFPSIVGTRRVATIHNRLAEFYARYLPIKLVPCPLDIPPLVEAMQWHRYFDLDPGCQWLRGVLRDAAGKMAPAP